MVDLVWKPECPMCDSKHSNESIVVNEDYIHVDKECNKCGAQWQDVYEYMGMDIKDTDELFI